MNRTWTTHLRVYLPFAAAFYLSYLYRTVNNIIAPDIAAELGINPSQMGLLSAAYFLTFAASQLPLGVLLDRYEPRRVESVLLLFAGLGAYLFAASDGLTGLVVGRGLIGFGVSACLMGAFTSYVMWFPKERLALVNGFQMAAGGLGALTATAPVEAALGVTDWRGVFFCLAGLTVAAAGAVFFVVPEKTIRNPGETFSDQMKGVFTVFSNRDFWFFSPLAVVTLAAQMSIMGLWTGSWLRDVASLNRSSAATALLFVTICLVAGFLLLGTVTERLTRKGFHPFTIPVAGMVVFMIAEAGIVMELTSIALPLWMLFGFFGTSGILSYSVLSQRFPVHLAGRVNTALNLLVFVVAFSSQWGVGVVIDMWPVLEGGRYSPAGYQVGFGIILGLQILCLLWLVYSAWRRN